MCGCFPERILVRTPEKHIEIILRTSMKVLLEDFLEKFLEDLLTKIQKGILDEILNLGKDMYSKEINILYIFLKLVEFQEDF